MTAPQDKRSEYERMGCVGFFAFMVFLCICRAFFWGTVSAIFR